MTKEKRLTYIEDVLDMLKSLAPSDMCGEDVQAGYDYAIDILENQAKEHLGCWVRANVLHDNEDGIFVPSTNSRFCSACQSEAYWDHEWGTHLFKFCPFCGARMNKGE